MAALLVVAAVLGACGGSGSSAERTRLEAKLSGQTASLPADLAGCVREQIRGLPISRLRQLASGSANASPATKQFAVHLVTGCIAGGSGLSSLRSLFVQRIAAAFPTTLPAGFTNCVEDKASAITPAELSAFLSLEASQGQTAATAQAQAYGRRLAIACFGVPAVVQSFRAVFLKQFQQFAQTSRFSKAFTTCVVGKAHQITGSQLIQFALHPAESNAFGEALGRSYARACIAAGAKP
jgi:hypothetical protein